MRNAEVRKSPTPVYSEVKLEILHSDEWRIDQIRNWATDCQYVENAIEQQIPQVATLTFRARDTDAKNKPDEKRFRTLLAECDWINLDWS
jgi:hypothetical protein